MRRIAILLCAALALVVVGHGDPNALNLDRAFLPPSADAWLGTDHLGRDLAARVTEGTRRALVVVSLVGLIALPIGLAFGLASALCRKAEPAITGLLRLLTAIPVFIVALTVTALFGLSPVSAGIALGAGAAAQYGLVAAAHARACLREPYALAAAALGAGSLDVARRHVLPAILPPLRIHFGSDLGRAVVAYSGLTFIGLGADTSAPDWGAMAWEYRFYLFEEPSLVIAPVIATTALATALHLLLDKR